MEKQVNYSEALIVAITSVFEAEPNAQAILVTNDDQVFHLANRNYCINHCREHRASFHELTRAHFEKLHPEAFKGFTVKVTESVAGSAPQVDPLAERELSSGKLLEAAGSSLKVDPLAWRELSFGKLLEYAQKELQLEPKTKSVKGAKALLAEIDALLDEAKNRVITEGITPAADDSEKGSEQDTDEGHNPVNPS